MNKNSNCYKEMTGAYLQACDTYSCDISGLCLSLRQIYQKYYNLGELDRTEEYIFDSSMGIAFRVKFYPTATEIYSRNYLRPDSEETLLVSKIQFNSKNFEMLKGMEKTLQSLGLAIGKTYPDEFRIKMNQVQPGTIISFSEGEAYVCEQNDGNGEVVLSPIFHGNLSRLKIDDFKKQDSITLHTHSQAEMQHFYQTNKKKLSQSTEMSCSFLNKSHRQIATIEGDVSKLHSKKVKIGSLSFVVKKAMVGDAILWYGPDGSIIGKEQIAYLIGYLNTNPTQTKYKRKEANYRKATDDARFRVQMEHLLDKGLYAEVYSQMCNYSKDNFDDLIIQSDSFIKNEQGEYEAGTLVFRNGEAYQISYENNDFSSEKKVSHLSLETFKEFCEQRYKDTYERNYATTMSELHKQYHSMDEQVLKNKAAIAKRMAESQTKQQTGTIFTAEEFKKGHSGFEDLIDNLDEDDPTIRTFLNR